jgi:hypothetical protein
MGRDKTIAFRKDIGVSHDARGFLLASRGLAGTDCRCDLADSSDRRWGGPLFRQWVRDGILWSISMHSKQGGTSIRVLLNCLLSQTEQEEWIDHFAWKLQIPDGQFALIGGGYDYLNGERDEYATFLAVPPDTYRVDVYTCFCGVNGPDLYEEMRDPQLVPMPVGAWFRKTRPGVKLPPWLRLHCYEQPECDPGYEAEYDDDVFDYDAEDEAIEDMMDFLVQLTPLDQATPLPAAPPDWEDNSYINPRPLTRCPRGVLAMEDTED